MSEAFSSASNADLVMSDDSQHVAYVLVTYCSIFHQPYKTGLIDNNVLLIAGPQMLTVTQQTPTSPQVDTETKMSK